LIGAVRGEPIKEPVKDGASAPEEPQAADAATPAMTTTSRFVESDGPPLTRLVDTNEQQRLIPPPPLPYWAEPLKGALRSVGCKLDNDFDTWLLSKDVPPKEAQRIADWLVDAKGRGKKYKSPRAFLNNWLSKVRPDGLIPDDTLPRRRPEESVRGHFPGGRQIPPEIDEDNRRAWEELRRQRTNEPRPYPCDCGEGSIRPTFFDGAWRYAVSCQACERKERTRRIRRAIEASGIPERFLGIEINEDIGRAKAILSLRSLIERRGAAVVLLGPTGTGKSLLAAKTAEAWLLVGKSVSWFSEEDYNEAMRPEGKGKERLTNDLLVVDDLGSGSSTEWARATFELLVCRRYDSMKSMILTTNLGKEQRHRSSSPTVGLCHGVARDIAAG
jgi:DNA replication protein DnaC